ncbi:aminoglycoside phosphotransferase family protein [Micromonospora costi]|uniref:Aminoglycoside phosphotransferase family protein n=1 Tax=Micromonospora costi TaxID=1530042 RepID=A0A3B0A784_9ACTN|nr:aminoglycoside phosphotransferase family protein [Micromonospora costi]
MTVAAVRGLVAAAAGSAVGVSAVERLRGGSKKGVFRLRLTDGTSLVLYLWHDRENWWSTVGEAGADLFSDASGRTLFRQAHEQLTALGVPVPEVLLLGDAGTYLPADVALVQDVRGPSLGDLLGTDPAAAAPALLALREALGRMRAASRPTYGRVGAPSGVETPDFPAVVLARALRHVRSAAGRDARIAAAADRLVDALHARAAPIRSRGGYSLVHGELGPDHVRLDDRGLPVLIDIEGLMWADVEWEHAFLELRFGQHYAALRAVDLDETRLRLYRLALSISLVEGPLRLLETGFPDADAMRRIAEHNLRRALAAVT